MKIFARAEDWNLSKPIETCSLLIERCGDQLHLIFRKQSDNAVFARSIIDLSPLSADGQHELQYYCEEVVDSSRYFCIRITDDKTGREARVGIGFRDRDFASNFRMSLQDYQSSLQRERKAHELQEAYENGGADDVRLSLKDGEKIHVNLGGKSTISKGISQPTAASPVLLKKPPPSPAQQEQLRISLEDMQIPDEIERHGDDSEEDSDCAVADDHDHDSLN